MAVDLIRWREDRTLQRVVLATALHSLALGAAMLASPRAVLAFFGFPRPESIFFPSQSGVFLVIMGICYARAAKDPPFAGTILLSKSLAVVFLLVHLLVFAGPPILWAAAAVDGGFFAATLRCLTRHGGLAAVLGEPALSSSGSRAACPSGPPGRASRSRPPATRRSRPRAGAPA